MPQDTDSPVTLIALVIVFYFLGLCIAFYIRIRKIYLIRQIKNSGRVITLSSTIISMLLHQLRDQQIQNPISPALGLPPPPPYTIETPPRPSVQFALEPPDEPPPYTPTPHVK